MASDSEEIRKDASNEREPSQNGPDMQAKGAQEKSSIISRAWNALGIQPAHVLVMFKYVPVQFT